ncbi:MAG TPA: hypothetical protein VF334_15090 [Polyangia bacterium]
MKSQGVSSFAGVKVFSATLQQDREQLGPRIMAWLAANPRIRVVDKVVRQSSDDAFHCLTFVLFYVED